ncbi:TIF1A [Mytilus edulis]|uniref:TRIM24 n=1 Tax=Mytilus edulis TaxID=6550 RepID=A0A8S3QJ96_MYTED|nr:TIF1A [Mytilus edulis]
MMALSKSLPSGQVPMLCQICEESSEIRWKCLLCDFLLCTKCQKLHKKVKSTDQHTIIDIKDIGTYQQEVSNPPDINNMPCSVHNGQNCCLFCQTCEEVICPLCILQAHKIHNMIGLTEGYKSTQKAVKDFHIEVEESILQTEKGLSKLGLRETSEKSKYESERQKILDRERVLKNEVESFAEYFDGI